MQIPFIKYSRLWLSIAGITAAASIVMIISWGLKPGIDFTGGSLLELHFSSTTPATAQVQEVLNKIDLKNAVVQSSGSQGVIVRTSFLTEEKHQEVLKVLRGTYKQEIREESFQTIGATVSRQLRERALGATFLVSMSIIMYLAFAFRSVNRPLASWKYGLIAIATLLYVVIIVSGVFAALGRFKGVEVDIAFVVAILTVLGYSVNDSIVVYDRIREHLLKRKVEDFGALVNTGLNETLARSINTVTAVLFPLAALYFFGGSTIHYFALALFIGMAMSTLASIFLASPLLVAVEAWQRRSRA